VTSFANLQLSDIVVPAAIVVGAVVIGFVFERLFLRKVRGYLAAAGVRGGEMVVRAFRWVVTLWFLMGGLYLALAKIPLQPTARDFADNVLFSALIFSAVLVAARIAGDLVGIYSWRMRGLPSSSLLPNVARVTVISVGMLVVLQSLGIAVSPIIATLGVGGLAFALAMQQTLSNLISGVLILASGQVRPGEYIKLSSGEEGYVEDINWRNTTIRALPNNRVIVPNSTLSASTITNYYQPGRQMSVVVPLRVGYECDLSYVEQVTVEVANGVMSEVEGGVPESEPTIRYNNFGEYSIDFSVIMYVEEVVQQYLILHEFIKRVHARYREEGIRIPFPTTTLHVPDGRVPEEMRRGR